VTGIINKYVATWNDKEINFKHLHTKQLNQTDMVKTVHENFIKSSNLFFISAGFGLINLFLTRSELVSTRLIAIAIISILFVVGLGYIIRQGFDWIKYILLVLAGFGLIGIVGVIIINLEKQPLIAVVNIIQTILQVWATVLLFRIPKKKVEEITSTDIE
jgi:hypothetical protein